MTAGGMEMDDNMETSEMRLASIVDRLESLLGKMEGGDMMEEEDIEEGYYPGHSDPNYHPYDDDADIRNDPRNRRRPPVVPAKDKNRTKDRYTRRDYERDYQREHADRRGDDPRKRPMEEQKLREAVRKALKASIKKA